MISTRRRKTGPTEAIVLALAVTIILSAVACDRIPEEKLLNKEKSSGGLKIKTVEAPVTTPENTSAKTEPEPSSTGEMRINRTTSADEEDLSRNQRTRYVRRRCVLFEIVENQRKMKDILYPGHKVEVLAKVVLVNRKNREVHAYRVDAGDGNKGYVFERNLCAQKICVEQLRKGVIKMYDSEKMRDKYVPQIKLELQNAHDRPVEELHVSADFYYDGNLVGTDNTFAVSSTHGIPPLKSGESSEVFLRPMDELQKDEVLSEENPIKVVVKCSIEYEKSEKCGEFYIDRTAY